jgi:hypothetical protein
LCVTFLFEKRPEETLKVKCCCYDEEGTLVATILLPLPEKERRDQGKAIREER